MLFIVVRGATVHAQERIVSGKGLDERSESLPCTSVYIKGTTEGGVATDMAGNYSIKVPENTTVLAYIFIGHEQSERSVGNQTVIDVVMEIVATQQASARKTITRGSKIELNSSVRCDDILRVYNMSTRAGQTENMILMQSLVLLVFQVKGRKY